MKQSPTHPHSSTAQMSSTAVQHYSHTPQNSDIAYGSSSPIYCCARRSQEALAADTNYSSYKPCGSGYWWLIWILMYVHVIHGAQYRRPTSLPALPSEVLPIYLVPVLKEPEYGLQHQIHAYSKQLYRAVVQSAPFCILVRNTAVRTYVYMGNDVRNATNTRSSSDRRTHSKIRKRGGCCEARGEYIGNSRYSILCRVSHNPNHIPPAI